MVRLGVRPRVHLEKVESGVNQTITIAAEGTSATINHGLGQVPGSYSIMPLTDTESHIYIDNEAANTSRLNVSPPQPFQMQFKVRTFR